MRYNKIIQKRLNMQNHNIHLRLSMYILHNIASETSERSNALPSLPFNSSKITVP